MGCDQRACVGPKLLQQNLEQGVISKVVFPVIPTEKNTAATGCCQTFTR